MAVPAMSCPLGEGETCWGRERALYEYITAAAASSPTPPLSPSDGFIPCVSTHKITRDTNPDFTPDYYSNANIYNVPRSLTELFHPHALKLLPANSPPTRHEVDPTHSCCRSCWLRLERLPRGHGSTSPRQHRRRREAGHRRPQESGHVDGRLRRPFEPRGAREGRTSLRVAELGVAGQAYLLSTSYTSS
ncbi:hypothetical protein CGRA01v4_06039 [Colletotrichum graminicola]|nr:hypothetical protein CGRA01v4_06039 [Colletotrichum graminicola]